MRCRSRSLMHFGITGLGLLWMLAGGRSAIASDDSSPHYSRWPKVRLAGFAVGAGVEFGGPAWFGYPLGYGYGPLGPSAWGDPFFAYPAASFYDLTMGQLKLRDVAPDAAVYLDGGYAGPAGKLKSMWIEPGTHELRIAHVGQAFEEKIYVLTGKTMTVNPENSQGGRQ